jgi:hypothetical protein
MNYIISQKQIEFLNKVLFDCNIPVQAYDNIVKLLASLPKEEGKAAVNTEAEASIE